MPTEREMALGVLASQDFRRYCRFVHRVELARHMLEWVQLLNSDAPEDRSACIAAPPEFWKSRILRMWIEFSIGREPEWCRILAMNAASQAEKQMKAIQATIEHNTRYKLCFPHVEPDYRRGWSGSSLYIKRANVERPEPTLFACGVLGPIQGLHAEEIYIDDPTDQQDVRSQSVMEGQREWVKGVLADRIIRDANGMPMGKFWVILTRWGQNDLWPLFTNPPEHEEQPGMGFRAIQMPAYNKGDPYEWGSVLWPEAFPMSRLDQLRILKGPALFAMTFLCNPGAMGGLVFDREKFIPFNLAEEEFGYRIHSWDVAGGKSDVASWTVCMEICVNPRGFYITHVWRERAALPDVKRMLYRLREDRKPNIILIEEKFFGQALIQEIDDDGGMPELRRVNPQGQGDKQARAQRHAGLLETGRLFVPRRGSAPWLEDLLDELAAFGGGGAYDDQVDALSQGLDYARGNVILRSAAPVSWMGASSRLPARRTLEW